MPSFFFKAQQYFVHTLSNYFYQPNNFFINWSFSPFVFNNKFYFIVDPSKQSVMRYLLHKDPNTFYQLDRYVKWFSCIFTSYMYYNNTFQNSLPRFEQCHSFCNCHNYTYIRHEKNVLINIKGIDYDYLTLMSKIRRPTELWD